MHLRRVDILPEKFPTREHYPFNLDVLQRTPSLSFDTAVTFFVGENGTGKSTLLEAITNKCGIYIWRGMQRTRYQYNPYEAQLYRAIEVQWTDGSVPGSFFGSQVFQNFAQIVDEWAAATPAVLEYFGGQSLLTQSHGQSLMSFFRSRYKIKGLYLLDEPETALSPRTQLDLLKLLQDTTRDGQAQFIIASHSPILLACPAAVIYSFDHVPVKPVAYEETEHYRVYKEFMADRGRYLAAAEAFE